MRSFKALIIFIEEDYNNLPVDKIKIEYEELLTECLSASYDITFKMESFEEIQPT